MKLLLHSLFFLALFSKSAVAARFNLGAGTEFPLGTGIEGRFEMEGFTLGLQTGLILSPYVNATNSICKKLFPSYTESTAELISSLIPNSIVIALKIGYQDFLFHGFLVEGGYEFISAGGGTATSTLLSAITGKTVTPDSGSGTTLNVKGSIHNLTFHLGYRIDFSSSWLGMIRLGVVKPVASTTTMEFSHPSSIVALALNTALTEYMNTIYRPIAFPVFSLALLYRFDSPEAPSRTPVTR